MNRIKLFTAILFFYVFQASAQVTLVSPIGVDAVAPGELVEITWTETIVRDLDNFDLYYSVNGGQDWLIIQEDISAKNLSYTWTVPDIGTSRAMIRIVQDNMEYQDLDDISGMFTITIKPPINNMKMVLDNSVSHGIGRLSAYPNPFHSEITFVLSGTDAEQSVTIDIYNLSGQKVTSLSNAFIGSHSGEIIWKPSNIDSGIYLVYIDKTNSQEVLKLIYEP